MLIGELARAAHVGVETVRFYERKGLIRQPPRPLHGGYRDYGEELVGRIRFIREAQQLGFSLAEIKELLALESDASADCGAVRRRAEAKRQEVEEKIRRLERIRASLSALIEACPGQGSLELCTIMETLSGNGDETQPARRRRKGRSGGKARANGKGR